MLAIYASRRRCGWRSGSTSTRGEPRAGIRAVFAVIGYTEKARQNLERAVELARGSDDSETILAHRPWDASSRSRRLTSRARGSTREGADPGRAGGIAPGAGGAARWLAQLAAYGADWERVETSTEASATLAEREGLVASCPPRRAARPAPLARGPIGEATVLFHRAHELAEQVGWSEIAFQALFGLALALRDQGDLDGATAALDQAIEVCDAPGLIAQSIQATARAAVILALAHRSQAAKEAAAMASQMAERAALPRGARGGAGGARRGRGGPAGRGAAGRGRGGLAGARPAPGGHPARLLAGQLLLGHDDERARELLEEAAAQSESWACRISRRRRHDRGAGRVARRRLVGAGRRLSQVRAAMTTMVASRRVPWLAGRSAGAG